jgi:hypothetical protein
MEFGLVTASVGLVQLAITSNINSSWIYTVYNSLCHVPCFHQSSGDVFQRRTFSPSSGFTKTNAALIWRATESSFKPTLNMSLKNFSSEPLKTSWWPDHGFDFSAVFVVCEHLNRSRGIADGIASGYWLINLGAGIQVPIGWRNFASPYRPDRLWGDSRIT